MSDEIFDAFVTEFRRSAGVMAFTQLGLGRMLETVQALPKNPENPDPRISIGPDAPTAPDARVHAQWTLSDLTSAAVKDGWLQEWLTHAWLTLIFARWENYYRPAFANAAGVSMKCVSCDVIGDIRRLRNDVVHHDAIATKGETGKCRVFTRIQPGERIILTFDDVMAMCATVTISINPAFEIQS